MSNYISSDDENEDLAKRFHKRTIKNLKGRLPVQSVEKKRARQQNFTSAEILCALKGYSKNQALLRSQKGSVHTGALKKKQWKEIARDVSLVSGIDRTAKVVEAKVASVRSKVKGPEAQRLFKMSLTGGGPPVDTETDSTGLSTQDSNSSGDNLKEKIRRLALSTIPKIQLVGIPGGIDLLKIQFHQDQQNNSPGNSLLHYKAKILEVFKVLKN